MIYFRLGIYEISDWVLNEFKDSSIIWYRHVRVPGHTTTFGIRIYLLTSKISHIFIEFYTLAKAYENIFNHKDVDMQFESVDAAKEHIDLFLNKFQKLKAFL
jgi:hypothetical protein